MKLSKNNCLKQLKTLGQKDKGIKSSFSYVLPPLLPLPFCVFLVLAFIVSLWNSRLH
jgi:hypothetical protein